MNLYESAFEEVLALFGKTVIIRYNKPRLDEQKQEVIDKNENVIYDSCDKETICTIQSKQDYEKTDFGYTKAKTKSVIAKFRKIDAKYLNKKSLVLYTSPSTETNFEYTISDVTEEAGHMKVVLT